MKKEYQIERFAENHCVVWLLHYGTNPFKEVVFSRNTKDCFQKCLDYKNWAEKRQKRRLQ